MPASGLGLAVAKDLLLKGWNVCLCDLNPPNAEVQLGDKAIFQAVDVTDYDALSAVFDVVWSKWKQLDFGKPVHFSVAGWQVAENQ